MIKCCSNTISSKWDKIMSDFDKFEAKIINVVDGDTCDLIIDLGFGVQKKERVRLEDIDTPERGEDGFCEAKVFLESYIGEKIFLETKKRGKYGRWIGTLYDKMGLSINQKILDFGLGVPFGSDL